VHALRTGHEVAPGRPKNQAAVERCLGRLESGRVVPAAIGSAKLGLPLRFSIFAWRSRRDSTATLVRLSPVSRAITWAKRWASGSLTLRLTTVLPFLQDLGRPFGRPVRSKTAGKRHGRQRVRQGGCKKFSPRPWRNPAR
jgi:hypothetical protein